MFRTILVLLFSLIVAKEVLSLPQSIGRQLYYTPSQSYQYAIQPNFAYGANDQYAVQRPQYQLILNREGEGGGEGGEGGFWQTIVNYFGACGGEGGGQGIGGGQGGALLRIQHSKIPPIDIKIPGTETEKPNEQQEIATEQDKIDKAPVKPFYYVIPPNRRFYYIYPQSIGRQNTNIKSITSENVVEPRSSESINQPSNDVTVHKETNEYSE